MADWEMVVHTKKTMKHSVEYLLQSQVCLAPLSMLTVQAHNSQSSSGRLAVYKLMCMLTISEPVAARHEVDKHLACRHGRLHLSGTRSSEVEEINPWKAYADAKTRQRGNLPNAFHRRLGHIQHLRRHLPPHSSSLHSHLSLPQRFRLNTQHSHLHLVSPQRIQTARRG